MPEYDNTNRGAMFKNDKKESERHPDMKGSLNVEGREYWVSAWKQVSKAGQGYVSLSITLKDRDAPRQQVDSIDSLTEDDIPF